MIKRIAPVLLAATLAACSPKSGIGFRLPDGDVSRGQTAYTDLRCNRCHTIEKLALPDQGTGITNVVLGGKTTRVHTYGELVTSIINPSHKILPRYDATQVADHGESLMTLAYLNDVLTVRQLIDLVAFLEAQYEVLPPQTEPYWYVYP